MHILALIEKMKFKVVGFESQTTSRKNERKYPQVTKENSIESLHKRKLKNIDSLILESKSITKQTNKSILFQKHGLIISSVPWLDQTSNGEISEDDTTSISTVVHVNVKSNPNNKSYAKQLYKNEKKLNVSRFQSNFTIATSSVLQNSEDDPNYSPVIETDSEGTTEDEKTNEESEPIFQCKTCESKMDSECHIKMRMELEKKRPSHRPKCEMCQLKEGTCKDLDDDESVDSMEIAHKNFLQELEEFKNVGKKHVKKKKTQKKIKTVPVPCKLSGAFPGLPPCCRESLNLNEGYEMLPSYRQTTTFVLPKREGKKLKWWKRLFIKINSTRTFETTSYCPYTKVMDTIASNINLSLPDLDRNKKRRSPYKTFLGAVKQDTIRDDEPPWLHDKIFAWFQKVCRERNPKSMIDCKPTLVKPPLGKPILKKEKLRKTPKEPKPVIVRKPGENTSPYEEFLLKMAAIEKIEIEAAAKKREMARAAAEERALAAAKEKEIAETKENISKESSKSESCESQSSESKSSESKSSESEINACKTCGAKKSESSVCPPPAPPKKSKCKLFFEKVSKVTTTISNTKTINTAPKKLGSKSPFKEFMDQIVKEHEDHIQKQKLIKQRKLAKLAALAPRPEDHIQIVTERDLIEEIIVEEPKKRKPGEPYVNPLPMPISWDKLEEIQQEAGDNRIKEKKREAGGLTGIKGEAGDYKPAKGDEIDAVKTGGKPDESTIPPVLEEPKKMIVLPTGPLGEDALYLRYKFESMWYESMFERLIGGYPEQGQSQPKKLASAQERLTKVWCKRKAPFMPKEVIEPVPVKFHTEPVRNICNCPFTPCLCVGRPKPKSRFFLRGHLTSRSIRGMMYDLCGKIPKSNPKKTRVLMEKLKTPTTYDTFVTTGADVKDVGPDFCHPRCAAYYRGTTLFSFKNYFKCKKKKKGGAGKDETQASIAKQAAEAKAKKEAEEMEEQLRKEEIEKEEQALRAKANAEKEAQEKARATEAALKGLVAEENEYFATRYGQTEETADGKFGPEQYSHILFGVPPFQEIKDIEGTNLQMIPIYEMDGDVLDEPSIIDKFVNFPPIQKHISSVKKMYSSVFGVGFEKPSTKRCKLIQTGDEDHPSCVLRQRMKKMTAAIKALEAKAKEEAERQQEEEELAIKELELLAIQKVEEKKRLLGHGTKTEVAQEKPFSFEENEDEHFKNFQLRPSEQGKPEDFSPYKLCPQTTNKKIADDLLGKCLIKHREQIKIPETCQGTSWLQKDENAHRRADKCSDNSEVAYSFSKTVFKTNRTDTSILSSVHSSTVSDKESTHSSLFYVDVGKKIILKKLDERTTREEREKRFSARNKKRNDNKTVNKKQKPSKTSSDFSSLIICGSKLVSGSSFEEKKNYSHCSFMSLNDEISYLNNSKLCNVSNATMKSDTDSLRDDVFDFNGSNKDKNRSDTFESLEDIKDDSIKSELSETIFNLAQLRRLHKETYESLSNVTIISNHILLTNKNDSGEKRKNGKNVMKNHNLKIARQSELKIKRKITKNVIVLDTSKDRITNKTQNAIKKTTKSNTLLKSNATKRNSPSINSRHPKSPLNYSHDDDDNSSSDASEENNINVYKNMLMSWITETKSYCMPISE